MTLLQLPRLVAGLAPDHPEADPERVEGGEQRAEVAADREDPVEAAAVRGEDEDLVLREEARGQREGGEREGADDQQRRGERQRPAEAGHQVDVLAVRHSGDHRAGRHEQERLEEGVGHQVEEARRVGADPNADDHVADLAHGRVGDDPLQVGDDQRDRGRDQQRGEADERGDVGGGRADLEDRPEAGDQVDAGGHHRRRVDQGGDRRRALHRVGEPGVERDLRRLRERPDHQQAADRDRHALVGRGMSPPPRRRSPRGRGCRARGG